MSKQINGTNPILQIVGDSAVENNFTLHNRSSFDRYESSLNLTIPAFDSVEVTLIGAMAYQQLQSNIAQLNALAGYALLEIVQPESEEPEPAE